MPFNVIAKGFKRPPPGLTLPGKTLLSKDGQHRCAELTGCVTLVSLWSEWCTPCLLELRDIASVQRRWRSRGFRAVAVLTASEKKLDLAGASRLMARVHAEDLELWIEENGDQVMFARLARMRTGALNLPCNLILDRNGVIQARAFGAALLTSDDVHFDGGKLTEPSKTALMEHDARTRWSTPAADEFVDYLLNRWSA